MRCMSRTASSNNSPDGSWALPVRPPTNSLFISTQYHALVYTRPSLYHYAPSSHTTTSTSSSPRPAARPPHQLHSALITRPLVPGRLCPLKSLSNSLLVLLRNEPFLSQVMERQRSCSTPDGLCYQTGRRRRRGWHRINARDARDFCI